MPHCWRPSLNALSLKLTYSIQEFMTLTGLGRTKVYEEIKVGRLRPIKCGRRTLISAQEVQSWLGRLEAPKCAA